MARKKATQDDDVQPDAPKANTSADDTVECFKEVDEINRAVARLGQKKATTFARFENMGVDTDAVKDALRLQNAKDPGDKVRRMVECARLTGVIPVEVDADGQTSALLIVRPDAPKLSKEADAALVLYRSFWAGHDAGYAGQGKDANPHEPGSVLYVDWEKGWKDGAEDLALKKPGVTKAPDEIRDRAATKPPETALEKDEAAYRGMAAD